jgi:N-acetylglutamate synthase-like GNAT family acetyltransferase
MPRITYGEAGYIDLVETERLVIITNLWVRPADRRRGVGTLLVEKALLSLVGRCTIAELDDMTSHQQFYHRLGFNRCTPVEPEHRARVSTVLSTIKRARHARRESSSIGMVS